MLSVVLVPLLAALVIVMLIRGERPIFFGAERMHDPTTRFTLWKLRTMTPDNNDTGVSGGDKRDRITPMGHRLRRTRMDELPQMWNILRGDISFVGPRPPLARYVQQFPEIYGAVLRARPGVTGLATLVFASHEEALLRGCTTPAQTERVYVRRCVPWSP
jgi:lipopolysaccharide/colanic/teichoic acid biosynthesis glycosyltransferase